MNEKQQSYIIWQEVYCTTVKNTINAMLVLMLRWQHSESYPLNVIKKEYNMFSGDDNNIHQIMMSEKCFEAIFESGNNIS